MKNELTVLFDNNYVKVLKENNETFYESNSKELNEDFVTNCPFEATSAFLRIPEIYNNQDLWSLEINKARINYSRILFWLSGGYKEWFEGNNYKYKWEDVNHLFVNHFRDTINEIIIESKTLEDVRNQFLYKLNMPVMYEFSLKMKLIVK